jgi:xyloglucan-specific exo-beta-1,4-glucanase
VRINDDRHQFGTIHQVLGDPKVFGRVYAAAEGRGILYATLE